MRDAIGRAALVLVLVLGEPMQPFTGRKRRDGLGGMGRDGKTPDPLAISLCAAFRALTEEWRVSRTARSLTAPAGLGYLRVGMLHLVLVYCPVHQGMLS